MLYHFRSFIFLTLGYFVVIGLLWCATAHTVQAQSVSGNFQAPGPTREELEAKIKEKSTALEAINQQLETTNQNLKSTQQEKTTLQKELKTLQNNITQLELNIKSDELTSQKLELEVDSLNYDIRDITLTVTDKVAAVGYLLRELQKTEYQNLLEIFLKNVSLADSVMETQSLKNVRSQLAIDIANLQNLQNQMNQKLDLVSTKQSDIELHQKNLKTRKILVQDQQGERKVLLDQTKNKETVYQKQFEDLKSQQDKISDEISVFEEQLRASFDESLLPTKRPGVFAWPVQMVASGGKGRITQHFGERSNLYRGRPHNGLDIGAPIGTPVFAAADGVIIAVDNNDRSAWSKYQYGKYIIVKHNNNLSTLYAHLSKQYASVGQIVKAGEVIGYIGSTGYATGPHLHFGVYWSASIQMKAVPPAAGRVPIGVVIAPEDYL